MEPNLQPLLHDLVPTAYAPTCALSGRDGQIRATGVHGVFRADLRVLASAVVRVDGREPDPIGYAPEGPGGARFVGLARNLGDAGPDPTVRLDRLRRMRPDGMAEEIRISSTADTEVAFTLTVEVACDLAPIEVVKSGGTTAPRPATRVADGLRWSWVDGSVTVTAEGAAVEGVTGAGAAVEGAAVEGAAVAGAAGEPAAARLTWSVRLPPGQTATLRWAVRVTDRNAMVAAPTGPIEWARPVVEADDRRLVRLLGQALDDLETLRLVPAAEPADSAPDAPGGGSGTFLGAGVPWFLTLFGRDSIWAARMMLPLGTELAAGTLRLLAARQGRRVDRGTGEAPGKIMHELRRHRFVVTGENISLPATYYGTVDATPLWISLLHDAWRWGMPAEQVAELLPALSAALRWLGEHADPDGDGFIEYIDHTGHGLANQGWKDSGDAVRFHDGSKASPPIALCEVQGYAYAAAREGAELLDAFDRPGGDRWREYAAALAERFRKRFWVDGPEGAYPAMALDRDGRPVDALTSNIGHLLGTGLLTDEESHLVAQRLGTPGLSGGYGLRTMSTSEGGYAPLSYHCGSVWPHDTAIVATGLARSGFGALAARLADGLLAAAEAFEYRLPELYGGDGREEIGRPVPYPAACRPQAWSAAAAVALLSAALGLEPDVPAGVLRLNPLPGAPLGAIRAGGLRLAGVPFDAWVERDGTAGVRGLPATVALLR